MATFPHYQLAEGSEAYVIGTRVVRESSVLTVADVLPSLPQPAAGEPDDPPAATSRKSAGDESDRAAS